ncbi:unnamed protein product [Cylindrotheca closterium]|uniref:Uncharacterized protein n=1 Tax=Cylindrotheca closterium TaxID=2856 RepID=A0AAD2GDM8_9STRA|nr:unnamed protein product [Cylindrotheca closterium]
MKDNIVNPPEKDPNLIMTVADQGQGGLKAKTRSNLTTQSLIALTKDNPAIMTPKRSSKRHPSETAEDGAMKGACSSHLQFPKFRTSRSALAQIRPLLCPLSYLRTIRLIPRLQRANASIPLLPKPPRMAQCKDDRLSRTPRNSRSRNGPTRYHY